MKEMNIEEILKMADELGISYELDSETPGFFIIGDEGTQTEVSIEEVLLIDLQETTHHKIIDGKISNALKKNRNKRTIQVTLDEEYSIYHVKDKGVA
ncbi:hypothetical protein D3C76_748700 [compost metagenome]